MVFKDGNSGSEYHGAKTDWLSVMEFVNEKTGRGPPKVYIVVDVHKE